MKVENEEEKKEKPNLILGKKDGKSKPDRKTGT